MDERNSRYRDHSEWREVRVFPEDVKVGDIITFREGHRENGLSYGDKLRIQHISTEIDEDYSDPCPIFVVSVDKKSTSSRVNDHEHNGFGYYLWNYDYLGNGICRHCINSCIEIDKESCPFYVER